MEPFIPPKVDLFFHTSEPCLFLYCNHLDYQRFENKNLDGSSLSTKKSHEVVSLQIEVLEYLCKIKDNCHLVPLQIAYHYWLLEIVTYYYDGNHAPVYAPLSYQRATSVTTP